MNSASIYTKVQVLKPNIDCKIRFVGIDELFLPFWHHFGDLDEVTPY
jgi:hypothetical protein